MHPVQDMLTATAVQRVFTAHRNQLIEGSRDKKKKRIEFPERDPGLSFMAVAGASNAKGTSKKKTKKGATVGSGNDIELLTPDEEDDDEADAATVDTSDKVTPPPA